MTETMTPGQQRTAKAIAARKRGAQERLAGRLRAVGWSCIPPEALAALRADLAEAEAEPQDRMQGYEIHQSIGYIEGLKHALAVLTQ